MPEGSIIQWIQRIRDLKGREEEEEQKMATTIMWSIWKERNNKIFRSEEFNINGVIVKAKRMMKEWKFRSELTDEASSKDTKMQHKKKTRLVWWEASSINYVKINFDGSFRDGNTTTGFIIRYHHGRIIKAGKSIIGKNTVLLEEATVKGVKEAIQLGYKSIEVEWDNTIVIQLSLRGEVETPWTIATMIKDTRKLFIRCVLVNVRHTFRKGNRTIDWVTSVGHMYNNEVKWIASPSLELDNIMQADTLGMTLKSIAS